MASLHFVPLAITQIVLLFHNITSKTYNIIPNERKESPKSQKLMALMAIKHDKHYRKLYERVVARIRIKRKGIVAVMRKLLELSYMLYKTETEYISDYGI